MRVLTIANQKGGVAKTTTALNLSAGLIKANKKILVVDLDIQGDLSTSLNAPENIETTLAEAIAQNNITKAIVCKSDHDIIPASFDLASLEKQNYDLDFSNLDYDFVIIDCPPNIAGNTLAAIRASTGVIVPTTADFFAYKSVKAIAESISFLQKRNKVDTCLEGILITRNNSRQVINKQLFDDLQKLSTKLQTRIYNTVIRECVAIRESQLMKQSIFKYDENCNGAQDYQNFVQEVIANG